MDKYRKLLDELKEFVSKANIYVGAYDIDDDLWDDFYGSVTMCFSSHEKDLIITQDMLADLLIIAHNNDATIMIRQSSTWSSKPLYMYIDFNFNK